MKRVRELRGFTLLLGVCGICLKASAQTDHKLTLLMDWPASAQHKAGFTTNTELQKVFVFDLQNADPNQVQSILAQLFPGPGSAKPTNVFSATMLGKNAQPARPSASINDAEAINAQAIREYQRRFEIHLANPRTVPVPVLYPTKPQKIVEQSR
jgi:hypothetical protein